MQGHNICTTEWCPAGQAYNQAIIGKPAPKFNCEAVKEFEFINVNLDQFKGRYVVLFFYPCDFTFVCPTEILAFNDAMPEFEKLGCTLLAASCDSKHVHYNWCEVGRNKGGLGKDLKLTLIADTTKNLGATYGCLFLDGPNAGITNRATFIIDPKGILRHASYSDLPVGREPSETLRLVEAFQFADENGMVCPAKWKKGEKTMNAGQKESKEYFDSVNK